MDFRTTTAIQTRRFQRVIAELSQNDYEILSQTDISVQMRKRKQFSWLTTLFLLVFTAGIGLIAYIAYLVAPQEDLIYLTVDDRGTVSVIGNLPFALHDRVRELNGTND